MSHDTDIKSRSRCPVWRCRTLLLSAALMWAAGCAKSPPPPVPTEPSTAPATAAARAQAEAPPDATVTVSAAASTREALQQLADRFRADRNIEVILNTGPSSGLANQIIAGAPADVFLSASSQWSDALAAAGLAAEQTRLLTNSLVIVVPASNPAEVAGPEDLLREAVRKVALAGEKVPAGMYADQALTRLNLLQPLTAAGKIVRGQDVRVALSYVERGEAEAGIVYSTDVRAAQGLKIAHEFNAALHDEILYVLVRIMAEPEKPAAKEFYQYLQSPDADPVYTRFGFRRPVAAAQP